MESKHDKLIEEATQFNHNITAITSTVSMLQKNYSAVMVQVNELLMQNQTLQTQLDEKTKEVEELKEKLNAAEEALKNMTSEATPVSEGAVMDY